MKTKKPDYIFECRKCGCCIYVGKNKNKMLKCPECNEGGWNWILIKEEDFFDKDII